MAQAAVREAVRAESKKPFRTGANQYTACPLSTRQAFESVVEMIRENSSHPKVRDATYQLEVFSAAMWPDKESDGSASADRWRSLRLTALESRLADLFVKNMGRTITQDQFFNHCYFERPDGNVPEPKMFNVLICKLRKKLKASPYCIETVWGHGYRMELKQC